MKNKSYPIIDTSAKTLQILKYVAKRAVPTSPREIEERLEIKYATVMAHMATLEREGYVENVEGGFICSLELATFWAARKRLNNQLQKRLNEENKLLNVEGD